VLGVSGLGAVSSASVTPAAASSAGRFTPEQLAVLTQLRVIDRHVRAHEQAHLAAAGPYATGGPSYTYAVGPDGNLYAVGGEVTLDVSPDPSGPEATIRKARIIEAAANAPADPSSQDRAVAAAAAQMEAAAERELSADQQRAHSPYQQSDPAQTGQLLSLIA
jgi:hypothetical protein